MPDGARVAAERRTAYEPAAPVEQFIVPLLRAAVEAAIASHAPMDGGRALDAGCGGQPFRAALERARLRYSSFDVHQNAAGTVEFVGALDGELPAAMPRSAFDLVLCTEVLEHVAGWDRAFDNLAAVTAAHGKLIVTVPFVFPLHEEPHDFWRPTPHAIRDAALAHGFRVVEVRNLGDSWDVLGTVLSATWTFPAGAGLGTRIRAALARWVHARVLRALVRGPLRAHVALRGPWFLSTLAVLERT